MLVPLCSSCKPLFGVEWVKLQPVTAQHLSEDWDCSYLYSEILSLHG